MREIKFRVRDAKGSLIGYNRFDQGRWSCQMLKGRGSGEWSNGVLHGPHMDQFTGLHDTNGVEVYGSDIVVSHAAYNGSGKYPKRVQYDFHFAGWDPLHSEGFRGNDVEVIGNIYENPELLKSPEDGS